MFRIIFIVTLVLIAMPFFTRAKNYVTEKASSVKTAGEVTKKVFRYGEHDKE